MSDKRKRTGWMSVQSQKPVRKGWYEWIGHYDNKCVILRYWNGHSFEWQNKPYDMPSLPTDRWRGLAERSE